VILCIRYGPSQGWQKVTEGRPLGNSSWGAPTWERSGVDLLVRFSLGGRLAAVHQQRKVEGPVATAGMGCFVGAGKEDDGAAVFSREVPNCA